MPFFLGEEQGYDQRDLSGLTLRMDPYFTDGEQDTLSPSYPNITFHRNYRTPHGSPCTLSSGSDMSDDVSEISVGTPHSSPFNFDEGENNLDFDFEVSLFDRSNVPPLPSLHLDIHSMEAYHVVDRGDTHIPLPFVPLVSLDLPPPQLQCSTPQHNQVVSDEAHLQSSDYPSPTADLPGQLDDSPPRLDGGLGLDLGNPGIPGYKRETSDGSGLYGLVSVPHRHQLSIPPPSPAAIFLTLTSLGLDSGLSSMFAAFCREHTNDFGVAYPLDISGTSSTSMPLTSAPLVTPPSSYNTKSFRFSNTTKNIEPSYAGSSTTTSLNAIVDKTRKRQLRETDQEDEDQEGYESGQSPKERRRLQNRNAQRTFRAKYRELRRVSQEERQS